MMQGASGCQLIYALERKRIGISINRLIFGFYPSIARTDFFCKFVLSNTPSLTDIFDLSDEALLSMIRIGDHNAFKEIFRRYNSPLYVHAYNKLRDTDDADDVIQEVFSRLWSRREQLEENNNLKAYLFKAVRNQIFDLLRHKKVITVYENSFNSFDTKNYLITDYLVRERQFALMIEKEIASLPARMREVFELRRKEHLSNKAIALRMGISEATVANQMKKALRSLRTKLGLFTAIIIYLNL